MERGGKNKKNPFVPPVPPVGSAGTVAVSNRNFAIAHCNASSDAGFNGVSRRRRPSAFYFRRRPAAFRA